MNYISTRGNKQKLASAAAIITGIADDGGLFVPAKVPAINDDFIKRLLPLCYQERAVLVLQQFLTDYTDGELKICLANAYGEQKFADAAVAPTVSLAADTHILELWHGPTSAFKDMALQLLPQLMSTALRKTGEKSEIIILVATSGDTGKAALEGFKDVEQIKLIVFYPQAGVSRIQRLQMVTQEGGNVAVVAVDGNFDDAQTGVKKIFNDNGFNADLAQSGYKLSSANSINWGRLVPQIVYYFSAYADLVNKQQITIGQSINFVVPTGNFGNILAGYYARSMGLEINKLICASNANNVLTEFLTTGTYNRNRAFYKTTTPSMDILISSNLERLLYHISGGNAAQVNEWMTRLSTEGEYTVAATYLAKIKELFWANWADDKKTAAQIKFVYDKYHYVMDPHTAVAWQVMTDYQAATGDKTPNVIVSTASPYKFNESVLKALAVATSPDSDEFALLDALAAVNPTRIPQGLAKLRNAKILHKQQCNTKAMPQVVKLFMNN